MLLYLLLLCDNIFLKYILINIIYLLNVIHLVYFITHILINIIYLLNVIHLVYFITRHLIIYLTACSIILTRILITHFTFLINFNVAMSYLLIVKR